MHNKNKRDFEMYYAYLKKETNEIGSANVSLSIGNDELFLIIEVHEPILLLDLQELLSSLQTNVFNRLHMDIVNEFKVLLYVDGIHSIVSVERENNEIKVISITESEYSTE